ncbi:hypothetical protein QE152_g16037 [Popillia japonica]|uniref:Uncharacterized protein n=1 Tax=Popillia japonica TaxID=7064 RepID=A0AAW1L3K9_POPJA
MYLPNQFQAACFLCHNILMLLQPFEILTDEISGDEDGGELDNLSKRQLLAHAEARTASGKIIGAMSGEKSVTYQQRSGCCFRREYS